MRHSGDASLPGFVLLSTETRESNLTARHSLDTPAEKRTRKLFPYTREALDHTSAGR